MDAAPYVFNEPAISDEPAVPGDSEIAVEAEVTEELVIDEADVDELHIDHIERLINEPEHSMIAFNQPEPAKDTMSTVMSIGVPEVFEDNGNTSGDHGDHDDGNDHDGHEDHGRASPDSQDAANAAMTLFSLRDGEQNQNAGTAAMDSSSPLSEPRSDMGMESEIERLVLDSPNTTMQSEPSPPKNIPSEVKSLVINDDYRPKHSTRTSKKPIRLGFAEEVVEVPAPEVKTVRKRKAPASVAVEQLKKNSRIITFKLPKVEVVDEPASISGSLNILLPGDCAVGDQSALLRRYAGDGDSTAIPASTKFDVVAPEELATVILKAKEERRIREPPLTEAHEVLEGHLIVRQCCVHCSESAKWKCNRGLGCNICIKNEASAEACRSPRSYEFVTAPVRRGAVIKQEDSPVVRVRKIPIVAKKTAPKVIKLEAVDDKPVPSGQPILWADTRTDLCETLPWHRGFQSGAYHTEGHARGILLDACASERDFVGSRVIIARAGGDRVVDRDGNVTNGGSISTIAASTTEAFKRSMRDCVPIGIILGNRNPKAPAKLPHVFNGLTWFTITSIWDEKEGDCVWTKYRFEKIENGFPSWWVPEGYETDVVEDASVQAPRKQCGTCQTSYPQLYEEGWTCLNRTCNKFWKRNGRPITNDTLHYLPEYLREVNVPRLKVKPAFAFAPKLVDLPRHVVGFSTSRAAWKGFVCPRCRRCNARTKWGGWECVKCLFKHDIPNLVFGAALINNGNQPLPDGHAFPSGTFQVPNRNSIHGRYTRQDIDIPGAGKVVIFRSNAVLNGEINGPDMMFEDLQDVRQPLKRLEIKNGQVSMLLTRHFGMNHGMSYKYAADVNTDPMSAAPMACRHAMGRLTWAKDTVEQDTIHTEPANELLTLAYMEDQSIGFHDDGEEGLGPVIATLSLGAPAKMALRLKAKYYSFPQGISHTDPEPMLGCYEYAIRHEAWAQLQTAKRNGTSPFDLDMLAGRIWRKILMANPKLKQGRQTCKAQDQPVNFMLHHGDLVIMQGAPLQKYYEHAVTPENGLRFAITARYIDPASVAGGTDEWKAEIVRRPEEHAADYVYDEPLDKTF